MIKLNNTITKKIEEFKPLKNGEVSIYSCGITLYDHIHIGHLKNILSFEVLRNYFEYKGFKVTFVRNITDIDDKIINKSIELNKKPIDLVNEHIDIYHKLLSSLEIRQPTIEPRATQYLDKIISFIEVLEKKGVAYKSDDGIYFNVARLGIKKYPLSGKIVENNIKSEKNNYNKKNDEDFALWKKDDKFGYQNDNLNYLGRPGWHIECSAMHLHTLGEKFDIHAGGSDLIFPHHENEISQSKAHNGVNPANYWLHNRMMTKDGQKLSKSLGNSIYVKDLITKYDIYSLKYYLLKSQYDSTQEYDEQELKNIDKKFKNFYVEASNYLNNFDLNNDLFQSDNIFENKLIDTIENNLNTPIAISLIEEQFKDFYKNKNFQSLSNIYLSFKLLSIIDFNASFDNFLQNIKRKTVINYNNEIKHLLELREQFRLKKNFLEADKIRAQLQLLGYNFNDKKLKIN